MLRLKMVQIQDKELWLLEPSFPIQKVFEIDQTTRHSDTNSGIEAEEELICTPSSFGAPQNTDGNIVDLGPDFVNKSGLECGLGIQPDFSIIDPEFTRAVTDTWDLYDQLQSLDGSFNDLQPLETMDTLMSSPETSQTSRTKSLSVTSPIVSR